jgi:CRP/FNR family transcriptional regulator, cyclic AMP receptor protein
VKVKGVFLNSKTIREFPSGGIIFEEGSEGDEMFGIVEGEVEVRMPGGLVRKLGVDETFGEMAIIDSTTRSATAVAAIDTKLAVIDRQTFLFLVTETPMFALQVMSTMAERLRSHDGSSSYSG